MGTTASTDTYPGTLPSIFRKGVEPGGAAADWPLESSLAVQIKMTMTLLWWHRIAAVVLVLFSLTHTPLFPVYFFKKHLSIFELPLGL